MRQLAAALAVTNRPTSAFEVRALPTPEELAVRRAYVRRERARRAAHRRAALARLTAGVPQPGRLGSR